MKKLLSILALTISFLTSFALRSADHVSPEASAVAQAGYAKAMQDAPEMADGMRSNGKIYVVVGVILIVLTGLFIYLFSIERKVKKLEQKLEDNR